MNLLKSPAEMISAFTRLIRNCTGIRWAVAWASEDCPIFDLLKQHEKKIEQMTVGVHFYQTHPDFIEAFLCNEAVRFVMNPLGIFHPKVYWFGFDGGHWECIAGSPNFTHAAFTVNSEAAVLFTDQDVDADSVLKDIDSTLNSFFAGGKRLTDKELAAYRSVWQRQQGRLNALSGTYTPPPKRRKPGRSPLDVPLFVSDWHDYFDSVKDDKEHSIEARLDVLEHSRSFFESYEHFSQMNDTTRKLIAGFSRTKALDWGWFGSMKGAGNFKKAINENNQMISDSLDKIPLHREVTHQDYDRFLILFRRAFESPGIATATRLLALKRPDYFVCLDSKNRRKLCEEFKIPSSVNLDDYWEQVVQRILDSNWWNSPEPQGELEKRIWKCRAAFLDVRFYDPGVSKGFS
jgi:HKD family nuclease